MNTMPLEADTRVLIDKSLENLGWVFNGKQKNVFFEQPKTERERKKLGGKRPDYVLYAKDEHGDERPIIVIEAKRKGERVDAALEQGIHYAKQLEAPIVFATDGLFCKSYHTKFDRTPILNGEEVDEFLRETLAIKYLASWEVNTVSPKVQYDRKELIKIFDEANNMLRGDGLRAGIERFGEFANILFLKLISENEQIKSDSGIQSAFDTACHWGTIKNIPASTRIDYINNVYQRLNNLYQTEIFTPLTIRSQDIIKEIMDKLDPLMLTDVDSDVKGDAFEYFLKESTASKNDLGEYFTPRHIVKTMVKLVNPQIGEKVYDPFCGTGGFLIESFRHIWNTMPRNANTEKMLREETIYGNEITNTARITKMNMILAGDGHSNIHMRDSLANPVDGAMGKGYDIVITNMPYSQKSKYGTLYDLPSNNGDSICVQHCMKAINATSENGRMALVVPEGFLFRKDLSKTRELLLRNCNLQSIISLPQGVFLPYTGVKTNIIYATKVNQKLSASQKRKDFWYFDVKSDGYTLDNHRRKLDSGSDLDKYQEYRKLDDDQRQDMLDVGFEIVPLSKVKENSYILVGSRYREQTIRSNYEVKTFEQIATLTRGVTYPKTAQATNVTETIILPADNIDLSGNLILNKLIYLHDNKSIAEEKRLRKGDIFICMSSGSKEHIGKVAYISDKTNFYAGGFMGIIRTNPSICLSKWLFYYLRFSPKYRQEIKTLTQGANINNISGTINTLKIPIPPLEIQEKFVDELDSHQRIIDGARAVVENYASTIYVDSRWEIKKLKDLCSVNAETVEPQKVYGESEFIYIDIASVENNTGIIDRTQYVKGIDAPSRARRVFKRGDILMSTVRPNLKAFGYVDFDADNYIASTGFAVLTPKNIESKFLYYMLFNDYIGKQLIDLMGKGMYPSINKDDIEGLNIPVPSIEEQKRIVSDIEMERSLVEPSKKLIEVFSKKMQDRIKEIWGE